jgi:hypothetical protein
MASEGSPFAGVNLALVPAGLLALALLFSVLSFAVGWFAVTTRVQVWNYDETQPDGKGDFAGVPNIRVHTEFELLQLNSRIEPRDIERGLEQRSDLPSYEREMDQTGSKMLGIFLLNLVTFAGLVGAGGFYFWNRRSRRDLTRTVWRFTGLFVAFALFSLLYLYTQVPTAARNDTREVLEGYAVYIEQVPNFPPNVDPRLFEPNIQFWNKWICCPPDSHYTVNNRDVLVVVTTESHPSAGFWFTGGELVLVGAAMALAVRTGQLGPKEPEEPKPADLHPTYRAA